MIQVFLLFKPYNVDISFLTGNQFKAEEFIRIKFLYIIINQGLQWI